MRNEDASLASASQQHYNVLGVPPSATLADITKAYHAAARLHHPDRQPQPQPQPQDNKTNSDHFLQIQQAWECLRCPERRRAYDWQRKRAEIQKEQRRRSAIVVERGDCLERRSTCASHDDGDNDDNAVTIELTFACRCGQELLVNEADPDDSNLLACHGCSLLYDTTPVWQDEHADHDDEEYEES